MVTYSDTKGSQLLCCLSRTKCGVHFMTLFQTDVSIWTQYLHLKVAFKALAWFGMRLDEWDDVTCMLCARRRLHHIHLETQGWQKNGNLHLKHKSLHKANVDLSASPLWWSSWAKRSQWKSHDTWEKVLKLWGFTREMPSVHLSFQLTGPSLGFFHRTVWSLETAPAWCKKGRGVITTTKEMCGSSTTLLQLERKRK